MARDDRPLNVETDDFGFGDPRYESAEPVDFTGKSLGDLLRQVVDVVREPQRAAGKDDRGIPLRRKVEVLPPQPKLPQNLVQAARSWFRAECSW